MQRLPLHYQRPTQLPHFLFGAPYYPEHWTEADMAHDAEWMAAAGFNVVRMAEFAWDRMEPEEGRYDFSLFDRAIARLGAKGIKTILCTPTAAPPRWLTYRHPEVLQIDANGQRMQHGSRRHACMSSPVYRDYSRKITAAMAEHFKDNPYVIGWQIDNEFYCHIWECFCPSCQEAYRAFLQTKYGDIATLNHEWGTAFWALTYNSFAEIELPLPNRPTYPNPSAVLDHKLFLSHVVVTFQREQVEILRAAQPNWFITHNGLFRNIDYWEFSKDLDFMGVDIYPMFNRKGHRAREAACQCDVTRSYGGNFIVPELQSGPGGQGSYLHDNPQPGEMRLFAYQAMARGADGILHFRWRTARFGAEEYWVGVLDHDNIPRRRYAEVAQEGREFRVLSPHVMRTVVKPQVGILFDPGLAEMSHQPITHGLPSPAECARAIHQAWYEAKYSVGMVNPHDELDEFKLLILPSWPVVTPELAQKLGAYVQKGGVVLLTARCGVKYPNGQVIKETRPGVLAALAGMTVEEATRVNEPEVYPNYFEIGEARVDQHLWLEQLQPTSARVLAHWRQGYQQGWAAVTANRAGAGTCVYVGTYLDAPRMAALIPTLGNLAGVAPLLPQVPANVEVAVREGADYQLWFVLNHSATAVEMPVAPPGRDLLSGKQGGGRLWLPPFGVAVFRAEL